MNEKSYGKARLIKAVIFDTDGMVVNTTMFSTKFSEEYKVPYSDVLPFFQNEFQLCVVGKADLKEVVKPYLRKWGWNDSVDSFLDYWFKTEDVVDQSVINMIAKLRKSGIKCYLATNQEMYRTKYLRQRMGFYYIFDKIYSSAEVGYKKPQPEFFQAIMKDIGLANDEVQFWDDTEKNVTAAKEYGIDARLYTTFSDFESQIAALLN